MKACQTCSGNGEIVTDWDRYLQPYPGDVGDEAVAECPDCDGEGAVDETPVAPESARLGDRVLPNPNR